MFSLSAPPRSRITLEVGTHRFATTIATLRQESAYFSALFSGRWSQTNVQADGSYFIDADGDLFKHILRYLQNGVFPLFYDNVKGFDDVRYLALLGEARYYQIRKLEEWIKKKSYLNAVKVTYEVNVVDGNQAGSKETVDGNTVVEYRAIQGVKKVLGCPNLLLRSRCTPSMILKDQASCIAQHWTAINKEPKYAEENVTKFMVTKKQVVVDHKVCIGEIAD